MNKPPRDFDAIIKARNHLFSIIWAVPGFEVEENKLFQQQLAQHFAPFIDGSERLTPLALKQLKRDLVDLIELRMGSDHPQWRLARSRIFRILGVEGLESAMES